MYAWVLYVECMCVVGKLIFNILIYLFSSNVDVLLSILIPLNKNCSLRGNFLRLVFYIWSLLLSPPSLNVRVEFFRFPGDKRRFVGDTSVVCLFRIPYYPPFRIVLHSSVLSLSVVCWLQICIRELIFNPLIFLLVSELHVAFCNARFFCFVSK